MKLRLFLEFKTLYLQISSKTCRCLPESKRKDKDILAGFWRKMEGWDEDRKQTNIFLARD